MWRVWTLTLLLVATVGCATVPVPLPQPIGEKMSLVVGRFILEDPSRELLFGPRYVKEGIEVFIGGYASLKVITDKEGYFYAANLPPRSYLLRGFRYSETFIDRGGLRGRSIRFGTLLRNLPQKTFDVPANSVLFVGTFIATVGTDIRVWDQAKYGGLRVRYRFKFDFKPEFQTAKAAFIAKYAESPWAKKALLDRKEGETVLEGDRRKTTRSGVHRPEIFSFESASFYEGKGGRPKRKYVTDIFEKGPEKKAWFVLSMYDLIPNRKYRFQEKVFAPSGELLGKYKRIITPTRPTWHRWISMSLSPRYYRPKGTWRIEVYVNGSLLTKKTFRIVDPGEK